MKAILASYSSDSEDDLHHDSLPPPSQERSETKYQSLNQFLQDQDFTSQNACNTTNKNNTVARSDETPSATSSERKQCLANIAGRTNPDVRNQEAKKRRGSYEVHSSQPALNVFKTDNIMPYIPKSKRVKVISGEENTNGSDSFSSVLKKAKTFSKKTLSPYYAPRKRVVQFDAHQGCVNRISWNPCFRDLLLSASMDSSVKIWNVETKPCCLQQMSAPQAVKDAKWNSDGLRVLSACYDKFSRITDINTGKEVCVNNHNSFVTCVLYHPCDPNVYMSGTANDGIFAWDVRTQQIQDLTFLPDGQSFVSAAEVSRRNSTDRGIMVWDYNTSTVLSNQVFQEAYTCTALQTHPNEGTFLAQCNAGYIAVFSQKSPYRLNKYKRFEGHQVCGYHIGMNVSPDGKLVASASSDGSLYVYNYRTSNIIKTFALNSQPCMDVSWSPTVSTLLASCDWSGRIFLHR